MFWKTARAERIIRIATYLACTLLLIWPALYNGYPILYSDTGSYVASGMRLETPVDRPITYGLFIRITSLGGFTLWTTIACQAVLMVRLLELLLLRVRKSRAHHDLVLLCSVLLLAAFTSLPWVVAQAMADIFTAMLVLCVLLLFLPSERTPRTFERVLLYFLFFYCVAAHLSHPLFVVILLSGVLVLRLVLRKWTGAHYPIRPIWAMMGLSVLAYPIMSSAIAKSGNIFFMGAMAEHGVAKVYLDAHCADNDYKLCAWKDRFPERAFQFHWDPNGPMGAYADWPEANKEFGEIIGGTISDPKFIATHIRASLAATWKQLGMFAIGDGWGSFREGSDLHYVLSRHMRHDMPTMLSSRQYQRDMVWIQHFVPIHAWAVHIALLALAPLLYFALRTQGVLLPIAVVILMSIVLSAWGSGTFSGEVDRFGCKMIWLAPLLAILAIFDPQPRSRLRAFL